MPITLLNDLLRGQLALTVGADSGTILWDVHGIKGSLKDKLDDIKQ